jgi:hypothetical protein
MLRDAGAEGTEFCEGEIEEHGFCEYFYDRTFFLIYFLQWYSVFDIIIVHQIYSY